MRELTSSMSSKSSELSFALLLFAIVIFLGIIGLFVVVAHRQKRKRQLKALLRAKNLGPLLDSKEIAQATGQKYYPKYTNYKKYSTSESRGQTPNPDIEAIEMPPLAVAAGEKKIKKLDINDLLAGIMVRMRNAEYSTSMNSTSSEDYTKKSKKPVHETSFYYKESSLSDQHEPQKEAATAVQVHQDPGESSSVCSNDDLSYVSRISQQVFVSPGAAATKTTKKLPQKAIKTKFATFFSSVSKYKSQSHDTKL
jgi:hypothetical protein